MTKCASKQPEKVKPEQEEENEELASKELERFMKCTSSSFDGNVLKIFHELNTFREIYCYGSTHTLFVTEENAATYKRK